MPVSGSNPAPPHSAPPTEPGSCSVPFVSVGSSPRIDGGVKISPRTYGSTISSASARSSGVKSIRSSMPMPWRSKGSGFVGNGCVGEIHSPGVFDPGTGRSTIGQTGSPVTRSKT